MEKVKSLLTEIPETMLTTLWAKAVETDRPNPLLRDEKAKEIIGQIDYDFSKFKKAKLSQVGCCIRAKLIDNEVRMFLAQHPDAVVIQLGAGLDARYERLGRPEVMHWFDLDLKESIDLRRHFLTETERNTYLAESMFDEDWLDKVRAYDKPVLIILEGVLMYFSQVEVQMLFQKICDKLPSATVLFDMLAFAFVGREQQHDMLRKMDKGVRFKWSLLKAKDMERWNSRLHVKEELFMGDYDEGRFPFVFHLFLRIPYIRRRFNQRIIKIEVE